MRRSIATVSVAVLGLALITPGAAHAEPSPPGDSLSPADQASLAAGVGIVPKAPYGAKPKGPNPFLAEVADPAKVDYLYYVVKPGTCGEHFFTADYDKFLAASDKYNSAREAQGGAPTDC